MNEIPEESIAPQSWAGYFQEVPGPRIDRRRLHKLGDILVIGLCSQLTGGEGFEDMDVFGQAKQPWLKTFLERPHGIPSHDTFNRVFSAIDPTAFLDCFVRWVRGICPTLNGEVVAIDAKALRHALDEGSPIPYIVGARASQSGLVLGQVNVNDKSNEITAIPELLDALELNGSIVTLDAMGCQKDIAARIAGKKSRLRLGAQRQPRHRAQRNRGILPGCRTALRNSTRKERRSGNHGLLPDTGKGSWKNRNAPVLAIHRYRVVRRQNLMETTARRGHGRIHPPHQG